MTFNPQAQASTSEIKSPTKGKRVGRRVSFADAGQVLDNEEDEGDIAIVNMKGKLKEKGKEKGKRQSRRSHTVLNTSATVSRMKSAEKRRVCTHLHLASRND